MINGGIMMGVQISPSFDGCPDLIRSHPDLIQFTVAQIPSMSLDVKVTPDVLWPPNNKMVRITADIKVTSGSSNPGVQLISITANKPLARDDIQQAYWGTDCRTFLLRATRLGSGSRRVYAITYRAIHSAGYSINRTVYVVVPHDNGK